MADDGACTGAGQGSMCVKHRSTLVLHVMSITVCMQNSGLQDGDAHSCVVDWPYITSHCEPACEGHTYKAVVYSAHAEVFVPQEGTPCSVSRKSQQLMYAPVPRTQ